MAVTTLQGLFDLDAAGKAVQADYVTDESTGTTAAVAASGFLNLLTEWNTLGTTRFSTLKGFPVPAGLTSPLRMLNAAAGGNRGGTAIFANLYKLGTISFTSTGNQFTHDAATFPILKKQMGTSQAVNGKLLIVITAAMSTTAAVMTVNYTNQAGASITGARTWTAPSVTTAVSGTYAIALEEGDTAIQDLTSINISVASASGTANVYLMEEHCMLAAAIGAGQSFVRSPAIESLSIPNYTPGSATSGTAVTEIMPLSSGLSGNTLFQWQSKMVYDS